MVLFEAMTTLSINQKLFCSMWHVWSALCLIRQKPNMLLFQKQKNLPKPTQTSEQQRTELDPSGPTILTRPAVWPHWFLHYNMIVCPSGRFTSRALHWHKPERRPLLSRTPSMHTTAYPINLFTIYNYLSSLSSRNKNIETKGGIKLGLFAHSNNKKREKKKTSQCLFSSMCHRTTPNTI